MTQQLASATHYAGFSAPTTLPYIRKLSYYRYHRDANLCPSTHSAKQPMPKHRSRSTDAMPIADTTTRQSPTKPSKRTTPTPCPCPSHMLMPSNAHAYAFFALTSAASISAAPYAFASVPGTGSTQSSVS